MINAAIPKSDKARPSTDYYPTLDEYAFTSLAHFLGDKRLPQNARIWECACGEGQLARKMIDCGYEVVASTLEDQGYGYTGIDFTDPELSPPEFDWIITNPPFSKSREFIRCAARFRRPFAFISKAQFWNVKANYQLFVDHPPSFVLPFTWRLNFFEPHKYRGGSPTMDTQWNVWMPEPSQQTVFRPLLKA